MAGNPVMGMSPEQIAELSDKDINKLPPDAQGAVKQARDYLSSDEGAEKVKSMQALGKVYGEDKIDEFNEALQETGVSAETLMLSEDAYKDKVGFWKRRKLKGARKFMQSDAMQQLMAPPGSDPQVRGDENAGFLSKVGGFVSGLFGGDEAGALEPESSKPSDSTRRGAPAMKLSGSVLLRKQGGGVMGTLDFEGAALEGE
jgi:hypothetical protein